VTRRPFLPPGSPLELRYAPEWRPFPTEVAEPSRRGFRLSWQIAAIAAGLLVVVIGLLLYLGSLRPGPSSTATSDVTPPVVPTSVPTTVPATAAPPSGNGLPAPVTGSVGSPMRVAGLRLTVVRVTPGVQGARPTPALRPGDRLYVVEVLYENASGRPAVVSPYDWALTDRSGQVYGAVATGLPNDLTDRQLPSGGSTPAPRRGWVIWWTDRANGAAG